MGRWAARASVWRVLTPVVCLIAGLGFAASATDSRGTELRAPGTATLRDTVRRAEARVHDADAQLRTLQRAVATAQRGAVSGSGGSGAVSGSGGSAAAQAANAKLRVQAGLTPLHGHGLVVVLDDSPNKTTDTGTDLNQLVVHQSDLQAVVNALWAGGAEAMSIAGQRVIASSAVRCVGNTLLLNGEVYSPPFRVAAIGPSATMQDRLAASPGVKLFREAANYFGLVYTVDTRTSVDVPGYSGAVGLTYAHVAK